MPEDPAPPNEPFDPHASGRQRSDFYPNCYASMLPGLRTRAQECGYALAVHGSMRRDFDLIAVPWTKEATDAPTLVEALRAEVGGFLCEKVHHDILVAEGKPLQTPTLKPHGRMAWSIYLGGGPYLDLSVMPRLVES